MRDQMQVGDRVLFYHSNAEPPAVVGVAEVVSEAYPDHTAWDPTNHHYDPASTRDNPVWQMIDVRFVEAFSEPLSLDLLRNVAGLEKMELLRKGSRLSVQPVSADEFRIVLALAHGEKPRPAVASAKKPAAKVAPKKVPARPAAKKVIASSAGKLTSPKKSSVAAKKKATKAPAVKKAKAKTAKAASVNRANSASAAPRKKK
jgi:predicted RNA-binding protein with PUA-like domain